MKDRRGTPLCYVEQFVPKYSARSDSINTNHSPIGIGSSNTMSGLTRAIQNSQNFQNSPTSSTTNKENIGTTTPTESTANTNRMTINDLVLNAFSHFVYENSDHQLLITSYKKVGTSLLSNATKSKSTTNSPKGSSHSNKNTNTSTSADRSKHAYVTEPVVHSMSGLGYGPCNEGTHAFDVFIKTHQCNSICQLLRLEATNALNVYIPRKSLVSSKRNNDNRNSNNRTNDNYYSSQYQYQNQNQHKRSSRKKHSRRKLNWSREQLEKFARMRRHLSQVVYLHVIPAPESVSSTNSGINAIAGGNNGNNRNKLNLIDTRSLENGMLSQQQIKAAAILADKKRRLDLYAFPKIINLRITNVFIKKFKYLNSLRQQLEKIVIINSIESLPTLLEPDPQLSVLKMFM